MNTNQRTADNVIKDRLEELYWRGVAALGDMEKSGHKAVCGKPAKNVIRLSHPLTAQEKSRMANVFWKLTGERDNWKGRDDELCLHARFFLSGFLATRMGHPQFKEEADALFDSGMEVLGFERLNLGQSEMIGGMP